MVAAVTEFYNPSHPMHELELKNYFKIFICDGCKEPGFGPRYPCEMCIFDLHEACMFPLTSRFSHELFPLSTFEFFRNPTISCGHRHYKNNCDACRRSINGFVYHCEANNLDLHPCCWNLKKQYVIDGVEFKLHREVQDKCMWCKKKRLKEDRRHENGWSYICHCGKYHFHVACMIEMFMKEWNKRKDGVGSSSTGNDNNESLSMTLGNMNPAQARGRGRGGGSGRGRTMSKKILKIFLKTMASMFIGNPTSILASLIENVFA